MFSLRIHSVDSSRAAEAEEEEVSRSGRTNPNPTIQVTKGIVHLYRNISSSSSFSQPSLDPLLPAARGTLLYVLAVPNRLSPEDFLRFCGSHFDHFSEIRLIRNDGMEDRYSVLVKFHDQKSADSFYLDSNGWRFSSAEAEVCHILFLVSTEYTESMEIAGIPPAGSTELPTCPVCLERLDQETSGIVTTACDHSFQCSCISKWVNSSCSVCRFCQEHSEKPTCSICETSEKLWICVICGFVGCGRYKEGHASRHWIDTQHCYSLDLETQRVWDYVGDSYVHRLNQSKSDGKLVKSNSHCGYVDENCKSCECSNDSGTSGPFLSSKVEAIVDEYNHLLESQLQSQREFYESRILEAKGKRQISISEAVEKAVSLKMQNFQLKLEKCVEEKKIVADINEHLMKNQKLLHEKFKEIEERERTTLKLKEEKICDLEEQIRDFTVFIEAQKTFNNMEGDDIRGGTLMPMPSQQPSSAKSKRSSKTNKRRN